MEVPPDSLDSADLERALGRKVEYEVMAPCIQIVRKPVASANGDLVTGHTHASGSERPASRLVDSFREKSSATPPAHRINSDVLVCRIQQSDS
jgi:hypothetical protein